MWNHVADGAVLTSGELLLRVAGVAIGSNPLIDLAPPFAESTPASWCVHRRRSGSGGRVGLLPRLSRAPSSSNICSTEAPTAPLADCERHNVRRSAAVGRSLATEHAGTGLSVDVAPRVGYMNHDDEIDAFLGR